MSQQDIETVRGEIDAAFEHTNEMRDGKIVRFENKVDQEAWAQGWGG